MEHCRRYCDLINTPEVRGSRRAYKWVSEVAQKATMTTSDQQFVWFFSLQNPQFPSDCFWSFCLLVPIPLFPSSSLWAFCFLDIMIASLCSKQASSCEEPFGTAIRVDISFHMEVQVRPLRRPIPLYTCVTFISGGPSRSDGAIGKESGPFSLRFFGAVGSST